MQQTDQAAPQAFSKQSAVFDQLDAANSLSGHLRSIVRPAVERHLPSQAEILELNCGTGLDAFYFASKGHRVLATDAAAGMIEKVRGKAATNPSLPVEAKQLSYHGLSQLRGRKFDHVFSNFGGLNCTPRLDEVLKEIPGLLKENGMATLVIMPKVCPWELLMMLKGKIKTAFRRFHKKTRARVEGVEFYCYYYDPSYVLRHLKNEMELVGLTGIYITVPPEFFAGFVERYPRLYRFLSAVDSKIANHFPFNRWCDHYMITLRKK